MTPEQKQQRDDALTCPGLKQKDVDFLVSLKGWDDAYLHPDQIKWLNDITARVKKLKGKAA